MGWRFSSCQEKAKVPWLDCRAVALYTSYTLADLRLIDCSLRLQIYYKIPSSGDIRRQDCAIISALIH